MTDPVVKHRPHPRIPHPDSLRVDPQQFNIAMVTKMAAVLGSVGFIWFCIALDTLGLAGLVYQIQQLFAGHGSLFAVLLNTCLLITTFVAQAVIQLVALPVLQNYANRQAAADDAKKEADHQALTYVAQVSDSVHDRLDTTTPGGLTEVTGRQDRHEGYFRMIMSHLGLEAPDDDVQPVPAGPAPGLERPGGVADGHDSDDAAHGVLRPEPGH